MNDLFSSIFEGLSLREPASTMQVQQLEQQLGISLPQDYVDFLRYTNGVEGLVKGRSYVSIWAAEDIVTNNKDYEVEEFAPGILLFGSDGGGEAHAFDLRDPALPIVDIPFIVLDLADVRPLARTFTEFIKAL